MDIHMPKMDGLRATREIRKFNKDIGIIGLSADVTREAIDEAKGVGMNDYFTKPISFDKLRKHLPNYLVKISWFLSEKLKIPLSSMSKIFMVVYLIG